ncbi:alpha/beta hydrolase [Sphingobacteriaceae bacterium]|nr:alpha/beta hydrolase [Sphingobacteriaceae bacterium]
MKLLLGVLLLCSQLTVITAQTLYSKAYGKPGAEAIIFLHGGPGASSIDFEVMTAQKLANQGFFVVVYDRRGEGRSSDDSAKYSFQQTFSDLDSIYTKYKLRKASLIGHSFGGVVATLYAEHKPENVSNLVLVSAPTSIQLIFRTVLKKADSLAKNKNDTVTLREISEIRQLDTTTLQYSASCFMMASKFKFYNPADPTKRAKKLYALFETNETLKDYTGWLGKTQYKTMFTPVISFSKNEHYTMLNVLSQLNQLSEKKIPVYALYGAEDGLYDSAQYSLLKPLCKKFVVLANCSHGVFMDQQEIFVDTLKNWIYNPN